MSKTIHGCTCKEDWSFAPGGKKYKGCVIGGPDNALCPLTKDPNKVKDSCRGSSHSRPYCAVKAKYRLPNKPLRNPNVVANKGKFIIKTKLKRKLFEI